MPKRLRPIGHEDRLSVVDHLDELRSRLIVCAVVLVVVFIGCFIESGHLLSLLNTPLDHLSKTARDHISGTTGDLVGERHNLLGASGNFQLLARAATFPANVRALFAGSAAYLKGAADALPSKTPGIVPITIGVGEPFTTTLSVCLYFSLLLSLPVLLYEAFAFVMPALKQNERRVITPILIAAPALFLAGVLFSYFIVLPAAIKFLNGYNASHVQSLIQASQAYSFEVLTMAAIGLAFEMPVLLLGLRAVGIINGTTLTRHWRYATVIIAVVAAAMPGADPVTTGLETAPLVVLFLVSIVLLKFADRRAARREAAAAADDLPGPEVGGFTGP
jgi:sec-independent protein translocase protein TatC